MQPGIGRKDGLKMLNNEDSKKIMAAYCGDIKNAATNILSNIETMMYFSKTWKVDLQIREALLNDWRDVCVKIAAAQKILQNEIDAFDK